MSSQSIQRRIDDLTTAMAKAAADEDYERAAQLRNEIEELKGETVRKPPPSQMGLGTHIPVSEPPKGWTRPKKPSPMTANVRSGKKPV